MLVIHASFLRKQESMYSGGLAICRLLLIAFSLLTSITAHAQVTPQGIKPVPGSEKEWPCDLAILSMGFVSPEHKLLGDLKVDLDQRNNVHAE